MVIVDTGVLFAVADAADGDHDVCDDLLAEYPSSELIVPTPVVVETSWLIESRLGPQAEAAFLRSFISGELTRIDLAVADWARATELIATYADLGLGIVDASVVAVAERLGLSQVASLDHRHFTVVRPSHAPAFQLLP